METTLNKIKAHNPRDDGWKELLDYLGKDAPDDDPIKITSEMVNVIGIKDAIWGLRAVEGYDKEIRLFSCACARSALPIFEKQYPDDNRPRHAIETAERYSNGKAGENELKAAADAAWAAWAAAWAARAADAAWAAACAACAARAARADAADATWWRIENIFCDVFFGEN